MEEDGMGESEGVRVGASVDEIGQVVEGDWIGLADSRR